MKPIETQNTKHRRMEQRCMTANSMRDGYRFVGAAGTRMPTTRVPAFRCGTDWPGWLDGAHPTVEDGKVKRTVCFSDRFTGYKSLNTISVKNCGSYFIYDFGLLYAFNASYCAID